VTFTLIAAGVPGVWGLSSDFVAQTYGEEHFGKTFGLVGFVIGIVGLGQLGMAHMAAEWFDGA